MNELANTEGAKEMKWPWSNSDVSITERVTETFDAQNELIDRKVEKLENDHIQAQGLLDAFKLLDGEAIDKVKAILKAIDVKKVEKLMKMIDFNEEGELKLKIELGVKKV
jgi:hypothetical protein